MRKLNKSSVVLLVSLGLFSPSPKLEEKNLSPSMKEKAQKGVRGTGKHGGLLDDAELRAREVTEEDWHSLVRSEAWNQELDELRGLGPAEELAW